MRAATNEAVKANMAIYAVDTRGLQAMTPVGDASTGSLRGTSAYSGAAMTNQLNSNFSSQETLGTLASDTGGKLFVDSNDFAPAFQQVQHDTEAYYILGFRSSNQAKDGTYRHLTIKLNRDDVKLDYRPGYYAPADFQHAKKEDREQDADGPVAQRPAGDGRGAVPASALLQAGGEQILCAGVVDRAGIADPCGDEWQQGSRDDRRNRECEGCAGDHRRQCARYGEAGVGCEAAGCSGRMCSTRPDLRWLRASTT